MGDPIVTVKQGKLRGAVVQSVLGPSYIAFRGVPFAIPPIGELRFKEISSRFNRLRYSVFVSKDPKPAEPWSGIRDALKNCDPCVQQDLMPPFPISGSEDCLHLNVYTASLTGKKPIMFWIHGGAFSIGTGNDTCFGPDYLVIMDVVLVCPNYRLGALGFLNMGHNEAPGNQGVKDLILALKWAKENAASFGGDPDNITIFGNSAGGALVDILCRSPATKGLFQKAILQSGSVGCPWAVNSKPIEHGFKLASRLGMNSKCPVEVVEFLRTVPAEKIVELSTNLADFEDTVMAVQSFSITVDDHAENPVVPLPFDKLLENTCDIPIIIGLTSHEYIMFQQDIDNLQKLDKGLMQRLKFTAKLKNITNVDQFITNIRNHYFDGKLVAKDKLPAVIEINTDIIFRIPITDVVDKRRKRKAAPTFFYVFSYIGNEKNSTDALLDGKRIMKGASHTDEVPYLFYLNKLKSEDPDPPALGTKDRIMMERLTRLWTNFAKTGNPTPSSDEYINVVWKPANEGECLCLDIGDNLKLSPAKLDIRRFKQIA